MRITDSNLNRIWQDFDCKTESYARRVHEGVDVLAASEFARLVEMSGLLNLLEENARGGVFPVRGGELRKKVHALLADCNEWFELYERSNVERALQIPRTQMERVNGTLEKIEKQLSRVLLPTVSDTVPVGSPAPLVIPGELNIGAGEIVCDGHGMKAAAARSAAAAYNPAYKT